MPSFRPGERVVERKLAALEGAEEGVLFATGMAAFVGMLMAHVSAGDEIVFFDECYHRSREFCRKHLTRFGVGYREVQTCDYEAMEGAIGPRTKFLISESPTNPHLSVIDVERFAAIGRRHGVATMIDATLCTPYNLRPLEAGVDFVLHSATKYLGGHNDLLAGVPRNHGGNQLAPQRLPLGAGPQDARPADGATQRQRPGRGPVSRIASPRGAGALSGSRESPLPRDRRPHNAGLRGAGDLLLEGPRWWPGRLAGIDAVRIPRIGPSLGGVESLIEQPLVMSYWSYAPDERAAFGIPDHMIRLACGIEDASDLVADLAQALETPPAG